MYVQALGQLEPQSFPNLGAPIFPVFSPKGDSIAFLDVTSRTIRMVATSGGSPVTIAPVTGVLRGLSWDSDDTVVFATSDNTIGLMRVPVAGGTPEVLTKPDVSKGEYAHWFPHSLPNGRGTLFNLVSSGTPEIQDTRIAVFDARTREYRTILTGASSARYVPTGHIIYATAGGTLRAARFDLERLEVVGRGVPVLQQVATKLGGLFSAGVSSNGILAYLHGAPVASERVLAWIDRDGKEEPIPAPVRNYTYPRLSPDGTRVALDIRDQQNDIWIWDLNRRNLRRLTTDSGLNRSPTWSPDGTRVAFTIERDGRETIYWQAADGTGAPEKLTEGPRIQVPLGFTPDGNLLFQEPEVEPFDLYLLNLSTRKIQPLLTSKFSESFGHVSPTHGGWPISPTSRAGPRSTSVPFPMSTAQAGCWCRPAEVNTRSGRRRGRSSFIWCGRTRSWPRRSTPRRPRSRRGSPWLS